MERAYRMISQRLMECITLMNAFNERACDKDDLRRVDREKDYFVNSGAKYCR
jgi:hypothetical protein